MIKVTILGCGVVGATIAYELSCQPQWQITVVDQQMPAQGSTGAALGVLMGAVSQKLKGKAWEMRRASLDRYETLVPELEAVTGQQIPYNRQGIVMLATLAAEIEKWQELVAVRASQGWELELWQPETLAHRCPHINQELNQELNQGSLWGALYSPRDRQIDPGALTTALVTAAAKNGVKFRLNTKIGNLQGLLSPDNLDNLNNLDTDWIILATGLGTTPLTRSIGAAVDVRPVLGQAIELELPNPLGLVEFQPVTTGNDIHIVPIDPYHCWVGATVEFPNERGEVAGKQELLEIVKQGAINFCPALAEGKVVRTWSGLRPRPEGQPAPVIKKLPGYDRIILATGHYRNGVLLAPATAITVSEILNQEH